MDVPFEVITKFQKEFDKKLQQEANFYKNYMNLFERLMWFVQASRERNYEIHLYSLHLICPYFSIWYDQLRTNDTFYFKCLGWKKVSVKHRNYYYFNFNSLLTSQIYLFLALGTDHGFIKKIVLSKYYHTAISNQDLDEYF